MGWISEVQSGVVGCVKLLAFREDWRRHFDVSAGGVARSFAGIVLALPGFIFTAMSINFMLAENPTAAPPEAVVTVSDIPLIWIRFWLLFPIVAALAVIVLRIRDRFAGWLVVHNWMVFTSIYFQAGLWALYMAGILNVDALLGLMSIYFLARFLIHWRVAVATLGLPLGLATAAALMPLLADMIMRQLLV